MESLALMAVLVMLSLWGVAAFSLLLSFVGFRMAGAAFGVLSLAAGLWLLCVLPHAPLLGGVNVLAGVVSVRRYMNRGNDERQE